MEQLSCLILQIKEQGIKSNQVSQSCMPEIIFTNWSRSVSHHFWRLLINTETVVIEFAFLDIANRDDVKPNWSIP